MLVPLGHGTTIQPACAALFGLILATVMLRERMTPQRIFGAAAIIAGLLVFGAESITTIGSQGVGGDLLFVTAGCFWATLGILLRHWRVLRHARGRGGRRHFGRRHGATFLLLIGYHHMLQMGLCGKSAADRRAGPARRHAADLICSRTP